MKRRIDTFSYRCGVIDCFNEIVHAGVKLLAMSHPENSKEERDAYLLFSKNICARYGTQYYVEDDPLITDLFPLSANQNTFLILYYQKEEILQQYLALKKQKMQALRDGKYEACRYAIACAFGRLLSYTQEAIVKMIEDNQEKESFV